MNPSVNCVTEYAPATRIRRKRFFDGRPDAMPKFLKPEKSPSEPISAAVLESGSFFAKATRLKIIGVSKIPLGGTSMQTRASTKLGADSLWLCLQVMVRTSEI